jgi:hypothetical protein
METHLERAAMILFLLSSLWVAGWVWSNYTLDGRIDACLDEGGAWHFEQSRCVGTRSSP